jgi:pimeloyl-ACP methyl ester carboxylesterase
MELRQSVGKNKHIRLTRTWKTRLSSYLIIIFVLLFAMGISLIALAKAERGVQYPYNRTIGLSKILNNVVKTASIADIRVCSCQPSRVDRVVLQDRFETTFFIYDHGGTNKRPGIVLIHGNVWNGQQLSTYQLVAHLLAKEGFIVLSFDKVGFGESDDPFGQGPSAVASAFDTISQLEEAVEYLIEHSNVDPSNITLLGHSGGVTEALRLGQLSSRIANVVAWVAPFAPANESEIESNIIYLTDKFHSRYELLYGRNIPNWFNWDLTGIEDEDPEDILKYYRNKDHKPLILVLGENDQPHAHHLVRRTFETLSEPKELLFIQRADHYLNTAQSLRWVFYDREIASDLIKKLVASLENPRLSVSRK